MRNRTLIQLILIGIVIMCFPRCYTADKAQQQVNKADSKFPDIVAKLARDKYPCKDLLKNDTAVIFKDTTIYIDCPDNSVTQTNPFEVVRTDTINKVITKTVRVPVTLPVRTAYITKWYEDSAKIKLYVSALNKANTENEKLKETVVKQDKKIANKNKENWIWRIIALALLVWQGIKLWKNITTIKMKSV